MIIISVRITYTITNLTSHVYVMLRFNTLVLKSGKKVMMNANAFVRFLHNVFLLHMFCHKHVIVH